MNNSKLSQLLGIKYPIIMAPMFLVTNTKMIIEALNSGISAAIPAMNFKTDKEFREAIIEIKSNSTGPFGVNLIVNKSNPRYSQQLAIILELKVDYIITSLGNPKDAIAKCKPKGIKVFCDVTDLNYAKKVEQLGADGIIAVNRDAGGHSGQMSAKELIQTLKSNCNIPVISAGGVSQNEDYRKVLEYGADGLSIGTLFIASNECDVLQEYKDAIVEYGADDIVMTTKMSGSPLSVINTPYVKQIGTKANFIESILNKNKTLKKYAKMLMMAKGMKLMEKAAFSATYKTVWVAGLCIENIKEIKPIKQIVKELVDE